MIVDSSLWSEPSDICKVFLTMLATKDSDHICRLTAYAIHVKCNLDEIRVLECLKILSSPDKLRKELQPFDGRRIKAVEDGWLILNGEKYRSLVQLEMKRARDRRGQAARRLRLKQGKEKGSGPTLAERIYEKELSDQ